MQALRGLHKPGLAAVYLKMGQPGTATPRGLAARPGYDRVTGPGSVTGLGLSRDRSGPGSVTGLGHVTVAT